MSLTKLLLTLSPTNLFKKDVITFLVIRRHDLGGQVPAEFLRYMSVRPNASLTTLRHKVWHLLDLPDYCEEKIVLKTDRNVEVPLTELRRGNTPQSPFILEVWLPERRGQGTTIHHMLTMGKDEDTSSTTIERGPSETTTCDCTKSKPDYQTFTKSDTNCCNHSQTTVSIEPLALHSHRHMHPMTQADYKKSELLSSRISSTTLLLKLQGKKSKDSFSNILLKIQADLNNLNQKLTTLEDRM